MTHPTIAEASLPLRVVDTAGANTTTNALNRNMNMKARRKSTRRRQRQRRLTRWNFSVALLVLLVVLIASSSPVAAQGQPVVTAVTVGTSTSKATPPPTQLSERLLSFIENVAQLEEAAADASLDQAALEAVIADLEFNRLRSFWEAPSGSNDFSQALLGNKENTCYAVYKGRSIPTTPFTPDAQTLPFNLERQDCDADSAIDDNDCLCQGHWAWIERNFPQSWQNQIDEMERCMNNCQRAFGSGQCELVMGGHGQGGQVAQLLSLHFANSDIQPFVIATGAASVLYNDDCLGFNSTRYVRLINTYSDIEADIGVCFDDVPFIGRANLKDIGYTVVLGESSGTSSSGLSNSVPSIALGPTTNLGGLVVLPPQATRSNLCRFAHEQSLYQEKVEELVRRNPTGTFLESGFSNGQYCEVDGDCLEASICEIDPDVDDALPVCIDMDEMIVEPDPTPSPTRRPTPSPTKSPTPSPTRSPTPSPTKSPTSRPTSPPTASPTEQPTAAPTQSPSSSPTIAPTVSPTTPRPTEPDDTPFPTELPSDSPSRVPTALPSQSPSALPTDEPTTAAPVMYPTTLNPTEAPTTPEDDTTIITSSPTEDGGEGGDTSTFPPTPPVDDDEEGEPPKTLAPTDSATPAPTPPTNIPLFKDSFRISITLFGVTEELQGFTVFTWESETSKHISEWILLHTEVEDVWNPPLLNLRVVANIINQSMTSPDATLSNIDTGGGINITSVESGASTTSRQGSLRRNLQSSSNGGSIPQALAIDFELDISYRTLNRKNLNSMNIILQAFESEEGRTEYIQRLRDTNDRVFGETRELFLEIRSSSNAPDPDSLGGNGGGGGDDNQTMVWVLVGAAVAAVVVSISLFAVYLKRADKKQKGTLPPSSGVATTAVFEQPQVHGPRYSQEIVVDPNADDGVSTIGDPTFYPGFSPMLNTDEPTASVSYARNYLTQHYEEESNPNVGRGRLPTEPSMTHTVSSNSAALSKVASGLTGLNESAIFTDNDSFEEQFAGTDECFEVSVPPGKLGVIVDLSENGEPMVRAIKPDSILADEVKIGDRLLSVDGEGCSEMTAEQVSRLIAMKAGQPYRKIMFCRKQSDYM